MTITEADYENGFVSLEGEFSIFDGKVASDDIKYLTLNEIRKYRFEEGVITATMTINNPDRINFTGLLLDEIYTAYECYINGDKVTGAGIVSLDKTLTQVEKISRFVPINYDDGQVEIKLVIANHTQISGQYNKDIYIGDYEALRIYNSQRFAIKLVLVGAFIIMSILLFSLYIHSKKHPYLLTLSLSCLSNLYNIVAHFDPVTFFHLTGSMYVLNTILYTIPTIFTHFFTAVSTMLFFDNKFVKKNLKKIIFYHTTFFLAVIGLLVVFDETVNFLYILCILYVILLMLFAALYCVRMYLRNRDYSFYLYVTLTVLIVTTILNTKINLTENIGNSFDRHTLVLIIVQSVFYVYFAFTSLLFYGEKFYRTQIKEAKTSQLLREKDRELKKAYEERIEMLTYLSHDLRSPITVIKGYLELLKDGKINRANQDQYINILYNKSEYLTKLIDGVFDLVYLDVRNEENFDIDNLYDIIALVHESFDRYDIVLDVDEEIYINCNSKQIYRLFYNLIDNAVSHGGDQIRVFSERDNGYVTIQVWDNGMGIDDAIRPYIFEKFKSGDDSRNTTDDHFGLGLANCNMIARNHDTTIRCETEKGKFTSFIITFKEEENGNINC
jgi:signal transduction histidine kinase